jgi:tRNA dimethylallyltransferase
MENLISTKMFNKEILEEFKNRKTQLPKVIIIYWPTACGKTGLSIDVAEYLQTDVIWADSRQIYRLMNIWTWKIRESEKKWVIHHMIDILDIDKDYSVSEYKKEVSKIINTLHSEWKIPVICWWTWLYLDAIAFNFDIPDIEPNWKYRDELEAIRIEKWNEYLWKMLEKIDPEYAGELEINNFRYVMRWLEVMKQTWLSKKSLSIKLPPKYEVLFITPYDWDRPKLYDRINERIEEMFDDWLVDEIKNILDKWYKRTDFWLNTIWYKEIFGYLGWDVTLEDCKKLVAQYNRNYAKRQLTWFRRYEI